MSTPTSTGPYTRLVEFSPAYDKRPKYGIHGVEMRMVLKGEAGAVQFLLFTNWQLPHVQKETDARAVQADNVQLELDCFYHPMPADLGYHSFVPLYEEQTIVSEACPYLDDKPCYYDGSGLNAERIYKVLVEEGSDGVWRELEAYYERTFHPQEANA